MTLHIDAIHRRGAFYPKTPCDFPEEAEVHLAIDAKAPEENATQTREQLLRELMELIERNPLPANAPRFTREELHERR